MKRFILLVCYTVVACGLAWSVNDSVVLLNANWQLDTIEEGIVLKEVSFLQKSYLGSNQHICVVEVRPEAMAKFAFAYSVRREYTSAMAQQRGAVVAVNGSFFDMKRHNSICYLKVDGHTVATNINKNTPYRKYYQYGTLVLADGKPMILQTDSLRVWEETLPYADIMTGGPLLMLDGHRFDMRKDRTFVTHRHNRTAIGIKADGTVLLVVVDGRFAEAEGMSLDDLCSTMKWLGCLSVLNMDGGGSSTCYVRGRGVVNYPSDNGRYDHEGERKVANAILLLK